MRTSPFAGLPARLPSAASARLMAAAGMPLPRGIVSTVMGNATDSPREIVARMVEGVEAWKQEHRAQLADIQSAFDGMNRKLSAIAAGGGIAAGPDLPSDPAYSRPFAQWFRHGHGEQDIREANAEGQRARINAALSVGDNSKGGYLAPTEWDRTVSKKLAELSPLRRICNVVSTSVGSYSSIWSGAGWGSGWTGETASRPQTTTPDLAPVNFRAGEIYAMPAISQVLLDDADFNIEDWLSTEVAETFSQQENIAFLSGDGTNKPKGLLTYQDPAAPVHPGGNLVTVPSGSANGVTPDGLVDFIYSLPSRYRQGARWLMASTTAAAIAKLKDGQGNYLWRDTYQNGQPATLLGFPVETDENMPAIAPGNTAVAFGDFRRGYTIHDRFGIRVLRDPFTAKPYVLFYTTKRVGGGVTDPNAIRLLKIAAS